MEQEGLARRMEQVGQQEGLVLPRGCPSLLTLAEPAEHLGKVTLSRTG